MTPHALSSLDDKTLVHTLRQVAKSECLLLGDFLAALAELGRRHAYLALGYPSLWAFVAKDLRLSNGATQNRIVGARLVGRMPAILDYIRDGRVSLKKVCLLEKVLSEDNHRELLEKASVMTEKEVEAMALGLDPSKAVPSLHEGHARSA